MSWFDAFDALFSSGHSSSGGTAQFWAIGIAEYTRRVPIIGPYYGALLTGGYQDLSELTSSVDSYDGGPGGKLFIFDDDGVAHKQQSTEFDQPFLGPKDAGRDSLRKNLLKSPNLIADKSPNIVMGADGREYIVSYRVGGEGQPSEIWERLDTVTVHGTRPDRSALPDRSYGRPVLIDVPKQPAEFAGWMRIEQFGDYRPERERAPKPERSIPAPPELFAPDDFADPAGLAKSPLPETGYSIAPPPPVSGTNYRAHMPHGILWQQYEGALRDASNPDNPGWARGLLGLLAIVAAPVAGAEEYGGRTLLNIPFMIDNLGTGAGEHIGRASLWMQQGEPAEATADLLGAIANLALGFLTLGMLARGASGSRGRGGIPTPRRPVKPGTPPALQRIDSTPGLTKDQIVEQDLDAWARRQGGVRQPSHYGNNQGLDRVYTFPNGRPLVVGEAKFKSGYELGQLEHALGQLKPGLKFGRQGSFEYSFWHGIRMTTSRAPTLTPAVRQTGALILKNLPDHRRVLAIGNEFGELDVWDLDFWEMYDW